MSGEHKIDLPRELKALMAVVSENTRISVFDTSGGKMELDDKTVGGLRHYVKNYDVDVGYMLMAVPIDIESWKIAAVCRDLILVEDSTKNISRCGYFRNLKFILSM